MTLTNDLDLHRNHHVQYIGQMSRHFIVA